jgi:hypothetical protein
MDWGLEKELKQKDINEKVRDFYEVINCVNNHRYKSWEHCYGYFKEIYEKGKEFNDLEEQEKKLGQYELGFYLASWGMLRGSSFLLQKDISVYKGLVEEVLKSEYKVLRDIRNNYEKKEEIKDSFKTLYDNLTEKLFNIKKTIKNHKDLSEKKIIFFTKERITDTLITKIILGTVGCIPAYDRYFKEGLKIKGFKRSVNPKKSITNLLDFYKTNKVEIDRLSEEFNYPPMKIIDMYFWKIGYDEQEKEG